VPIGKGSRVAIGGPPGAGATRLLQEIAQALGSDVAVAVALAGVRPEEVSDWRSKAPGPVYGGSFDRSPEAQAQAAELAVERGKRTVERGGHAVLIVDTLESLPPGAARRVFGAARKTEEGGSLTVIAATGMSWEPQRWATTRVSLDPPGEDGQPNVSPSRSGALRADLLG
jgi:transcription termination factor Rho